MSALTKKTLLRTAEELLSEKNLDDITVKEVVARCGVNRKTFYRHYRNLPDLAAAAAAENLTAAVGERIYPENWEQGVIRAMQWMQAHSAAVRHVYRSEYYGEIKRNLSPWLDELLEKNIRRSLEIYRETSGHDLEVTEREFRMIRRYFSAVVFAFLEEWISSGMQDAPEEYVDTMSVLIHDDMYPMFDRIWQRHQAVSS